MYMHGISGALLGYMMLGAFNMKHVAFNSVPLAEW